jgi:peptidoglycan/xylan/chitin deacetylase (PgdA/CDA1 family)
MRTGETHQLFDYSAIVDRPPLEWPDGKRLAFWIAPNIEHLEVLAPDGSFHSRDVARLDYGNRVGIWRVMEVMDRYGMRGTCPLNSSVTRHYPRIIAACIERGWEMMGHGLTNSQAMNVMPAADEPAAVKHVVDEIRAATGKPVRGWLGPGLHETPRTMDLLVQNGVEYVCDWVNDDQPYRMRNGLYNIPYGLDLNDIRLLTAPVFGLGDWREMIRRAFDTLYAEGGRVMCIPLHPFITGTPSRISAFEEALKYVTSHDRVWLTTGGEILDWFKTHAP